MGSILVVDDATLAKPFAREERISIVSELLAD
jgi:hypothetical protein